MKKTAPDWVMRQNAENARYRNAQAILWKYRQGAPLTVAEEYFLRTGDARATGPHGEYNAELREKAADQAAASSQAAPAPSRGGYGMYGMPDLGGSIQVGPRLGGGGAHFIPKSDIELRKKRAEMEWLEMEMRKREMVRRMNELHYGGRGGDAFAGSDPGDEIRRLLKSQLSTT